jgi:hypothetical protein
MTTTPILLSDKMYDNLVESIRKTYPNSCVLWIDKIENKSLEERFQNRYESILYNYSDVKIEQLYHGTSEHCMNNIIQNGFESKYNKVGVYGKGTYFSPLATMSAGYSKPKSDEVSYMFMCDVIIGVCKLGSPNKLKTDDMDNYVNSLKNPTIICCPLDDMSIPRYVIAFHRNAPV